LNGGITKKNEGKGKQEVVVYSAISTSEENSVPESRVAEKSQVALYLFLPFSWNFAQLN
jgi:hypothetical protein